jgi:hypothetical protein
MFVCDDLETMCKEVFVAYFNAFSQNVIGGTEEAYEDPPSGQPITRFELSTF